MKIDRLLGITMILLNKKIATAKELSSYFEVSERTIQRDIDSISLAGIPVYASRGKDGGYSILENYKLNKNFLTDNEINLLLGLLKGFKKGYTGREIKSVIDKISGIGQRNPIKNNDKNNKLDIDLSHWGNPVWQKKIIDDLEKARDNRQCINIRYFGSSGISSVRTIEPHKLIFKSGVWYIYAYCRLRDEFRLFRISRIAKSDIIDDTFSIKEIPDSDIENDSWNTVEKIKLKLKFSSKVLYRSFEICKYFSGDMHEDGSCIVDIEFPHTDWIYSFILSFGSEAEVIEPEIVRNEIIKRIENITNVYR